MTIPFIIADLGPSANQSAKPLAAFFPGYVTTQIPEGMLAQIVGAKSFPSATSSGLAALATDTVTASPVNAMVVAFFVAGMRPLGTCPGPTFASLVIFSRLALSIRGRV
jgi:hypothetical protein